MAQTYDPAKVTVTVDGTVMTGFSEDSMIKISPTGDAVTPVVSVQGEVAYTENADKTGTLTLSFLQTSSALPRLRSLFNRKAEFAVVVSDANEGATMLLAQEGCRITKMPEITRGKSIATQEVAIFVPNITVE